MRRFIQDKGRNDRPQVWEITRVKYSIQMMWGQLDGKMQDTTQDFEAVNVGKKNEKSPEDMAAEAEDREILKKTRQGYREVNIRTNEFIGAASKSDIDFIHLPENLRFFKPKNNVRKVAGLMKLLKAGDAWLLRKRDGMMHVASKGDDGHWRLFGSNMLINHKDEPVIPWMDRYPHLLRELERLEAPNQTILLGEIVSHGESDSMGHTIDRFNYVSSIIKSKTPLACAKQKESGKLGLCIWDIGYWGGQCLLQEETFAHRYTHPEYVWDQVINRKKFQYLTMPEIVSFTGDGFKILSITGPSIEVKFSEVELGEKTDPNDPIAVLLDFAKNRKWEGFVVVDPHVNYGDRAVSFKGKADRPSSIGKLKPKYEADFIVRWDPKNGIGQFGKGKKKKGVGSVQAYLWDPETKEEVPISLVGGGLTDENVAAFADPTLYPMVWQVEFDSWTEKGSLRFPEFIRVREDKKLDECELEQRPPLEDE